MENLIIDVRERDEFKNEYIKDSINVPLSELICQASGIIKHYKGKKILIMCKSGIRAEIAKNELLKLDKDLSLEVFIGGIDNWKIKGNETVYQKFSIPIIRQVLITAGSFILIFTLLAVFINLNFIYLTFFMSLGLIFAGITGFCGLAILLEKMPWNKQ